MPPNIIYTNLVHLPDNKQRIRQTPFTSIRVISEEDSDPEQAQRKGYAKRTICHSLPKKSGMHTEWVYSALTARDLALCNVMQEAKLKQAIGLREHDEEMITGIGKHITVHAKIQEVLPEESSSTDQPLGTGTFASSTTKVESEPPNGSNADIPNQCESEQALNVSAGTLLSTAVQASVINVKRRLIAADQASVFMAMMSVHISSGLVLHQMTSDHNRSELEIQDHSNEQSSSKLVPKVVP
ncbi:hypothetical protein Tco_0006362 [Tanacetum coccineum]